MKIGGKDVEAVERARDRNASAYSAYHSTKDKEPTKHGQREELPVYMCILNSGDMTIQFQIKYYGANDIAHRKWGSILHYIQLECTSVEGRLLMIDQETFENLGGNT